MKALLFILVSGLAASLSPSLIAQEAAPSNAVPAEVSSSNAVAFTEQDAQQLLPAIPKEIDGFLHLRERADVQRRKQGNTARAERVFRQNKGGGLFLITIIKMEKAEILEELSPPLHGKETAEDTETEKSSLKPFLGKPAFHKEIKDRNMSMIQALKDPTTLVEWRGIKINLKDLRPLARQTGLLDAKKQKPAEK